MKVTSAKTTKVKKAKGDASKPAKGVVFIGARRSGNKVTISLEDTKHFAPGQFTIMRSTHNLPKITPRKNLNSGQGWLQNPDLGNRLNMAFAKAVKAAKKQSAKLPK